MANKKQPYPSKTRGLTMTDEVWQTLQQMAAEEAEGNVSLAVRMLVKRWADERQAKQTQTTK